MSLDLDAVVVGAGLAGLTAALRLARAGRRVVVLERLDRAGGLCGHFVDEGYEFVRACNEFGSDLARVAERLGLEVRFTHSRSLVRLGEERLSLPPDARSVLRIARRGPALLRFLHTARGMSSGSIAEVLDAARAPQSLSDLVGIVAAMAGVPLESVRLEEMKTVLGEHRGFGWSRPVKVVGGPQALVDAFVAALGRAGAEVRLGVDVREIRREEPRDGGRFVIETPGGPLVAGAVVTSEPRWDRYPTDSDDGLALGQLALAVKPELRFPDGVQTLYDVPADVRGWMGELAAGRAPAEFAFNLALGLLPQRADHYTIVGFFALPRGERAFSTERHASLERELLARAERLLPGLSRALLFHRLYSPEDFTRRHGLSSQPVRLLPRRRFERPSMEDEATGLLHVGTSTWPPGNDGNAAVVSGWRAAELVEAKLAGEAPRPLRSKADAGAPTPA